MTAELLNQLLEVYTPSQLKRLVQLSREVMALGHGEVIITVKNNHPRFIGVRTSEDFMVECAEEA